MDLFKRIGDVCRTHYEKILLCLVLVGLAGAVVYLYGASQKEEEKIADFLRDIGRRKENPVKPGNMAHFNEVMQMAQSPPKLEYGGTHNLVNPVRWQRNLKGGEIIKSPKGSEPEHIFVAAIRPLNFTIAFDRVAGPGYWITITNEVASTVQQRRISQYFTSGSTNTKVVILREVKGSPEDPSEWVLEFKETGERVSIAKDKPFTRPEAYEADLRSKVEGNKVYNKQRAGMTVRFQGEDYKIFDIKANEVILLAPNDKKYTIRYKPGE
jgi:hypothetical protein